MLIFIWYFDAGVVDELEYQYLTTHQLQLYSSPDYRKTNGSDVSQVSDEAVGGQCLWMEVTAGVSTMGVGNYGLGARGDRVQM